MKKTNLLDYIPFFATSNLRKNYLNRFALLALVSVTLSMCKEPDALKKDEKTTNALATKLRHDQLKKEYGKILANALFHEKGVRSLLKEEALKLFNKDYEVLYHMVKDRPVGDGKTFRQVLLEHSGNESLLAEIEREMPLLTILVPELPQNSFSAAKWDVETQLPVVGLRVWAKEGVPMLAGNGEEFYFPFDLTPGFPVVVIKDNERVTTASTPEENTFKAPNTNFFFKFTDENFNNLPGKAGSNSAARLTFSIDQKLIDARNIMDPVQGWHRDHIYYGLTPSNDKGPFSLNFKERITSFRFNYGLEAYQKIAEQSGDPKLYGAYNTNTNTAPTGAAAWTDGFFEFTVNAIVNSKATGQPAIAPKFPVRGYDLFDTEYELVFYKKCNWYEGCFGQDLYSFRLKTVTAKTYAPPSVYLINWDLDKYAPTMAVTIKEVDNAQTTTTKETSSTEFAGNIGIDGADGILKKIGLKFGISAKKVFTSERSTVTTLESDDLGETTVDFGDKVITSEGTMSFLGRFYVTREYSTGWVSFSVEPARVQ